MTARVLPRELGVIIACDAGSLTGFAPCAAEVRTANCRVRVNRKALPKGWARGKCKGYKRRDFCPACAPREEIVAAEVAAAEKAAKAAERAQARAERISAREGARTAKKPQRAKATRTTKAKVKRPAQPTRGLLERAQDAQAADGGAK